MPIYIDPATGQRYDVSDQNLERFKKDHRNAILETMAQRGGEPWTMASETEPWSMMNPYGRMESEESQEQIEFETHIEKMKSGEMAKDARAHLNEFGPTDEQKKWAIEKYGDTSEEEIIQALIMDPTSPLAKDFHPLAEYHEAHKTGVEVEFFEDGTKNPNYDKEGGDVRYDINAPAHSISDAEWQEAKYKKWSAEYGMLTKVTKPKKSGGTGYDWTIDDPGPSTTSYWVDEKGSKISGNDLKEAIPYQKKLILEGKGSIWQQEEVLDPYSDEIAMYKNRLLGYKGALKPRTTKDYIEFAMQMWDPYGKSEMVKNALKVEGVSQVVRHSAINPTLAGMDFLGLVPDHVGTWTALGDKVDAFLASPQGKGAIKEIEKARSENWKNKNHSAEALGVDTQKQVYKEQPVDERLGGFELGGGVAPKYINKDEQQFQEELRDARLKAVLEQGTYFFTEYENYVLEYENQINSWKEELKSPVTTSSRKKELKWWIKEWEGLKTEGAQGMLGESGAKLFNPETGQYISYKKEKDKGPEDFNLDDIYTGTGSMYANAEKIAEDYRGDKRRLEDDTMETYYQLMATIEEAASKTGDIGAERAFGIKGAGYIRDAMGYNDTWYDDAKVLQKIAKTGKLSGDLTHLPGSHPLAEEINTLKNKYIEQVRALELNLDPLTSPKEAEGFGMVPVLLGRLTKNVTGEDRIMTGINQNMKRDDAVDLWVDYLEQDGMVIPQSVRDRAHHSIVEQAGNVVVDIAPLAAEILIYRKIPGTKKLEKVFDALGALAKGGKLASKSNTWNGIVNVTIGGVSRHSISPTNPLGTALRTSGLKEMVTLWGADQIGGNLYGREGMDPMFGLSMGTGMGVAESSMINILGSRIPWLTPILRTMSKSGVVSGVGRNIYGAGVGTTIMGVSEAATAYKNYLLNNDQEELAAQMEHITDMEHVLSTFLGMSFLGMRGNKVYDGLVKDFNSLRQSTPETRAASKALGIKQGSDQKTINDAFGEKVTELNQNPDYLGQMGRDGIAIEGTELSKKINELNKHKKDLEIYNDVALAKSIAKVDARKNGSYSKYKDNLWTTANRLKMSGQPLPPDQVEFLAGVDPKILADAMGVDYGSAEGKAYAHRTVADATNLVGIVDGLGITQSGALRNEAITKARDFLGTAQQLTILENKIKNNPDLKEVLEPEVSKLKEQRDIQKDKLYEIQAKDKLNRSKIIDKDVGFIEDAANELNELLNLPEGKKLNIDDVLSADEFAKKYGETERESDAFFDRKTNTIALNREVMIDRNAVGAGTHELLHFMLRDSFKDDQGNITPDGIKLIEDWKEGLSDKEVQIIENRISENYKMDAQGRLKDKNKYYEEYLTAFSDAFSKGKIDLTAGGVAKMKWALQPMLDKLGWDKVSLDSPEGLQNLLTSLAQSSRKGKLSGKLKEFVKKEHVPEVEVKEEVKVTEEVGKRPKEVKVKEKVEIKDVDKTKKTYETTDQLIKDLKITDAKALKEIKEAFEADIYGEPSELLEVITKKDGSQVVKLRVGGKDLIDIPVDTKEVSAIEAVDKELSEIEPDSKVFSMTTKRNLKWDKYSFGSSTTFKVGDQNYRIEMASTERKGKGNYSLIFGQLKKTWKKGEGSPQKLGITGTGNAAEVLSIVSNGVIDFVKKNKVDSISFTSSESSRTRLYERLTKLWADKLGWNHKMDFEEMGRTREGYFTIIKPKVAVSTTIAKKLIDSMASKKARSISTPAGDPLTSLRDLDKLDWKGKTKEEWQRSKEFEAAANFIYLSPEFERQIENKLWEGDPYEVKAELINTLMKFDPAEQAKLPADKQSLGAYMGRQFLNKVGTVGKRAQKKKAISLDKPMGEGETTFAAALKGKEELPGEAPPEKPAPISTMRKTKGAELTPKEVKTVEKDIGSFIKRNLKKIKDKDYGNIFTTKLKKLAADVIAPMLNKKIPSSGGVKNPNPKYEKAIVQEGGIYDAFEKILDLKVEEGQIKGDPYLFVIKGGKGWKDFIYKERGFTESGAPRRIQIRKGKENVAYDFMEFGDKPGQISRQDLVDFLTRQGKYKDWPSRPNELRTGVIQIMAGGIAKDATPQSLKKFKKELAGTDIERNLIIDDISKLIMRRRDLVLSKSKKPLTPKELIKQILEPIEELTSIDHIDVGRDLKAMAYYDPSKFTEWLFAHAEGKGDAWLNANPVFKDFFHKAIVRDVQEKIEAGKVETESSMKRGIDNRIKTGEIPKEIDYKGKEVELEKAIKKGLEPIVGKYKRTGKRYINLTALREFKRIAKEFIPFLPPDAIKKMTKGAVEAFLGESRTGTGMKDIASIVEKTIIKEGVEVPIKVSVRKKWHELRIDKDGKEELIELTDKQIDKELESIVNEALEEGIMETAGTKAKGAYKGVNWDAIVGEGSLRNKLANVWSKPTFIGRVKEAAKLFTKADAKAKKKAYIALGKQMEKFLYSSKNAKQLAERAEYLTRLFKNQTSLVKGFRQYAPTFALYIPKGKDVLGKGKERAKLEHLKPNVYQSLQTLTAILKGEFGTKAESLLGDYAGIFGKEAYFDIIDDVGWRTNISGLARITADLSKLKNYFTTESNYKESVYDKLIREASTKLKIRSEDIAVMNKEFVADALAKYLIEPSKSNEIQIKQILDNKSNYKKIFELNENELPFQRSKSKKSVSISDQIERLLTADRALANGREIKKEVRKARVFDFDDTIAKSKSNVLYELPDGTKGKLNAEQFARDGDTLLQRGAKFDFSEFNKVLEGKKGPLFDLFKKMKEAEGERDMFVLTARAQEAGPAIREFLKGLGVDIPLENITGLGDGRAEAKAEWMLKKFAEGYNDFYFADDAIKNVKAVKQVLDQLDVKSKVQQAIRSKSKDLNGEFNRILQATTGVEWFKEFSPAKAEVLGRRKGKGKFFLPPSAEDFLGLIYPTIGKGKIGENQLKWYETNLLKPYSRGTQSLATERVNMMADFKALKKQLNVPKDLKKRTESGFTNEQAVRIHLWKKSGIDIPGLSKRDLKELSDIVENNPKLKAFSEQLEMLLKGDGYSTPKKHWLTGTITTDLIDILNTTKRDKFLKEWKQNIDIIFSEKNLNKLESIYGKKYREALESTITRMKSGKNRSSTGNKVSDGVLDYINNAQGAIMFLNMRSAVLQTISAANFINLGFNNPYKAGKAFANQPQYWRDFVELMNSDYLVDRRNGLKLNIAESEIADAARGSSNKAKAAINYILSKGYTPTKFADSYAIASGGATWYRNRINDLIKKEKLSPAEAKKKAFEEFRDISEKSQQSSDPSKISQQQSSDLGRVVLQFVNTPMQYTRLQKRAFQDLVNKRGDWKTHVSKILYYGIMQNLWFNGMQQGLFALGFGDDEIDEKEEKKLYNAANGMSDSLLRGLGFAGMTVSVLKNTVIDIYRRSQRKRPEYSDVWIKLLEFSPAIKSKMSKLKSAGWPFDSKKRRAEVWDKGFSLDNPAWESLAKVVSAATNLPLDRLFNKYNNLQEIVAEDTEVWQGIAMLLGWPHWDIKEEEEDDEEEKKKKKKKVYVRDKDFKPIYSTF